MSLSRIQRVDVSTGIGKSCRFHRLNGRRDADPLTAEFDGPRQGLLLIRDVGVKLAQGGIELIHRVAGLRAQPAHFAGPQRVRLCQRLVPARRFRRGEDVGIVVADDAANFVHRVPDRLGTALQMLQPRSDRHQLFGQFRVIFALPIPLVVEPVVLANDPVELFPIDLVARGGARLSRPGDVETVVRDGLLRRI